MTKPASAGAVPRPPERGEPAAATAMRQRVEVITRQFRRSISRQARRERLTNIKARTLAFRYRRTMHDAVQAAGPCLDLPGYPNFSRFAKVRFP